MEHNGGDHESKNTFIQNLGVGLPRRLNNILNQQATCTNPCTDSQSPYFDCSLNLVDGINLDKHDRMNVALHLWQDLDSQVLLANLS